MTQKQINNWLMRSIIKIANEKGVAASEKGAANGVAALDASGKVPKEQLPKMSASDVSYTDNPMFGVTNLQDAVDSLADLTGQEVYKLSGCTLIFPDKTVETSAWQADGTYSEYGYRASISLPDCTTEFVPQVTFGLQEAVSGNFAPIAEAGSGVVMIYAKKAPTTSIVIPTILLIKKYYG